MEYKIKSVSTWWTPCATSCFISPRTRSPRPQFIGRVYYRLPVPWKCNSMVYFTNVMLLFTNNTTNMHKKKKYRWSSVCTYARICAYVFVHNSVIFIRFRTSKYPWVQENDIYQLSTTNPQWTWHFGVKMGVAARRLRVWVLKTQPKVGTLVNRLGQSLSRNYVFGMWSMNTPLKLTNF